MAARSPTRRVGSSALFDQEFSFEQAMQRFDHVPPLSGFLDALVHDPRLFRVDPGPLFDSTYYVAQNPDVNSYPFHPFDHFICHGFWEGRSPHPSIDLSYVAGQAHAARIALVTPDDLVAAIRSVNPHPRFSNARIRQRYGEGVNQSRTPLEYAIRMERSIGRAAPTRSYHGTLLPTASEALRLDDGSPSWSEDMRGLAGTARDAVDLDLVRGVLSAHGLKGSPMSAALPWPRTPSEYAALSEVRNPMLSGPLPEPVRLAVGVVLYQTDQGDFARLLRSILAERAGLGDWQPAARVHVLFAANDQRLDTYAGWLADIGSASGGISLARSESNVGFGRAHNTLMQAAFEQGADHYVGLNPDGFPLRGCFASLLRMSHSVEDKALIEADAFPVGHPKWFDPVSFDTEWVSGAAFLMPRGLFEDVGGFDERVHMYCEDVDLSWRVRDAGGQTLVCPTARFFHDVVPRFGVADPASRLATLLSARLLGHKWSNHDFVRDMEDLLEREPGSSRLRLPPLPATGERVSSIPDFEHGLRFAMSRYWQ